MGTDALKLTESLAGLPNLLLANSLGLAEDEIKLVVSVATDHVLGLRSAEAAHGLCASAHLALLNMHGTPTEYIAQANSDDVIKMQGTDSTPMVYCWFR